MSHESSILPSITSVLNAVDKEKKEEFNRSQLQNPKYYENVEIKEEVLDIDMSHVENPVLEEKPIARAETISKMINKHYEFIEFSRNITTDQFLIAASQLCHMDTNLAEQVWLAFFPRLWNILEQDQRNVS